MDHFADTTGSTGFPPLPEAARREVLDAVADLLRHRGANGFSETDVLKAVGVHRSEIASDPGLVRMLVLDRVNEVLTTQERLLRDLDSLAGLTEWRHEMVRAQAADIRAGCPLGILVRWIADHHEPARIALRAGFEAWEGYFATGLRRMIDRGEIVASETQVKELATAILAALQGGILLARTSRAVEPLEYALDIALTQVAAYAPERHG